MHWWTMELALGMLLGALATTVLGWCSMAKHRRDLNKIIGHYEREQEAYVEFMGGINKACEPETPEYPWQGQS